MRRFLLTVAFLLALPTSGSAQGVRVLFVPDGRVPMRVRRSVAALLANDNVVVNYDSYARDAAARGLYPSNPRALRRIATQQGADVILVARYGGHYRRRVLRLSYIDGRTGDQMAVRTHVIRRSSLRAVSQHAVLRDLAEAAGREATEPSAPSRPSVQREAPSESVSDEPAVAEAAAGDDDGGLPPPIDWDAEEAAAGSAQGGDAVEEAPIEDVAGEDGPDASSAAEADDQWGVSVGLGVGVAHRTNSVPVEGTSPGGLATQPFPALQGQVVGHVRPEMSSRYRLSVAARYTTSVGLVATEQRADGSTRSTDVRSHHLSLGVRHDIPLASGELPTILVVETGWAFRMFDADAPLSIPSYTLHGIYARVGLMFPIGDSPLSLGVIPEIGHAISASSELNQLSRVADGFIVGAEAHVRLAILDELVVHLMYREAHAILGSETGAEMNDAERYGILRVEYLF